MVHSHIKSISSTRNPAYPDLFASEVGLAELHRFLTSQGIVKELDLQKLSTILSGMTWLPDVETWSVSDVHDWVNTIAECFDKEGFSTANRLVDMPVYDPIKDRGIRSRFFHSEMAGTGFCVISRHDLILPL